MTLPRFALVLQLGTTLPLVGLIWVVQVVSYPLFARVGGSEFATYHAAHSLLITFVVAPLMLGELTGAIAWLVRPDPTTVPRPVAWSGAALAIGAWLLTLFVSVPRHEVLARGFDQGAHTLLVSTNWLRTVTWSARGALLLWLVARGTVRPRSAD